MKHCKLCPRLCNIDRTNNPGFCGATNQMFIRKVMLHQYEEPILTSHNERGSGTIFFAGCNLKCVYCQNFEISHEVAGMQVTPSELANIFKKLEDAGAGNIDLVTPTHYTNQIVEALKIYKPNIPVIWNTSGYESAETIKLLEGYVDVFLTDFKYADNQLALKYSKANNYVENAISALVQMKKQQPQNVLINNKLVKGIVVRHMVLPGQVKDSVKVLNLIKELLGTDCFVSIMSQYTPIGDADKHPEINRKITQLEYKAVISYAKKIGLHNAFIQDLESANQCYTPAFNNKIVDI